MKKYVMAIGSTLLGTIVIGILIHAVVLRDTWIASAEMRLPDEEINARVWYGWFSLIVIYALYGIIFSGTLGLMTIVPWPKSIIFGMSVQQFSSSMLLGLIFGIYFKD